MVLRTLIASGLASAAGTFDGIPGAGDNLLLTGAFDVTMDQALTYGTITLDAAYSGTATQGAVDFGYSDFSMAGGTWIGVTTKWQTCSGNFTQTGGTILINALRLHMTGVDKILTSNVVYLFIKALWISNNITINPVAPASGMYMGYSSAAFSLDASCVLTIASGKFLDVYGGTAFTNLGTIAGDATAYVRFDMSNPGGGASHTLGSITCSTRVEIDGATPAATLTLGASASIAGLTVYSATAFNVILDLAGYSLTATTIAASTRGIISGRGSVYCDGTLTATLGAFSTLEGSWYADKTVGCGAMGNAVGTNRTCSKTLPHARNHVVTELGGTYNG